MKDTTTNALLYLLFALVEVHSWTAPYLTFLGNTIPNHGYIDLNTVGNTYSDAVKCHSDLDVYCSGSQGPNHGDWFLPSGKRVPFSGAVSEDRSRQHVQMLYVGSNGTSGIYCCDIETVAANNDDGHETI